MVLGSWLDLGACDGLGEAVTPNAHWDHMDAIGSWGRYYIEVMNDDQINLASSRGCLEIYDA